MNQPQDGNIVKDNNIKLVVLSLGDLQKNYAILNVN